jgi:hypothetical protein
MDGVCFSEVATYEPEDGRRRVERTGSDRFTFECFEKRVGQASLLHFHADEQVCVCLDDELTVETGGT